jgi:hypothetical protein
MTCSNPRYKHFCQEFFTAGDEEQFELHRDKTNPEKIFFIDETDYEEEVFEKYKHLTGEDVTNTFKYIFHKFKKGIYIRIKDNKLTTFLPFSKAKFVNEWSDRIKTKENSVVELMKKVNTIEGRSFNPKKINSNIGEWYANNCLLRYEYPINEGDTGTQHMKSMFEELCENKRVPNMEFFVNRRDFPILKRDGTEPYEHIYDCDDFPLVSHEYDKYVPILSSVTNEKFADVPIPTLEDWARVKAFENVSFPRTSSRQYIADFNVPFEVRKPTAVFRGASTGAGVTIETNPRLKIAQMSAMKCVDEDDGELLLDAGITEWNARPRKIKGESYLKTFDIDKLGINLVKKLLPEEQANYKYIVNIDGHVSAFRLSLELNMGSVILMVESMYRLWFTHMLTPYENYIPVKRDLSDLLEKIKWCKKNPETCEKIISNNKKFYATYLMKDGILSYLQKVLATLAPSFKYVYPVRMPLDLQLEEELAWLLVHARLSAKKHCDIASSSSRSTVKLVQDLPIIVKEAKDAQKSRENIHDAYVGMNSVNYLCKHFPNFTTTNGFIPETNGVVVGKVNGETFFNWLNSERYNAQDYISILMQLALVLECAQVSTGFVHNDCFPWNVIIKDTHAPVSITYVMSYDKVVKVTTTLVPVLIDYGKTHVILNKHHYGFINMFSTSTIRDIFSITMSSLSILIKNKRVKDRMFKIASFFSDCHFTSYLSFINYVKNNCTFSNIISMDKPTLEAKTSFQFFTFMLKYYQDSHFTVYSSFVPRKLFRYKSFNITFQDKAYIYYTFQTRAKPGLRHVMKNLLEKVTWTQHHKCDYPFFNLSEHSFLNPDNVSNKLVNTSWFDFGSYCEIVMHLLAYAGEYSVDESDRSHLISKFTPCDIVRYKHSLATQLSIKKYLCNFA